jgi:hypothetical protein
VTRVKHFAAAVLLPSLILAGCNSGGGEGASGCTAGGLDAITARSNFELKMADAEQDGELTEEQLTRARDQLDSRTDAAQDDGDWVAYCTAIDDTRTELGLSITP